MNDISNLIKKIEISDVNLNSVFLYCTNVSNIPDIIINGISSSENILGAKESKRVFFSVGERGVLAYLDARLKWMIVRPNNKTIKKLSVHLMSDIEFPKIIYDIIFYRRRNSIRKFRKVRKQLKEELDNAVFLVLNLEEYIDFDYNDIDELKVHKSIRGVLKYIYSYERDDTRNKAEFWNMHTYSGISINKDKIALLHVGDVYSARKVLKHFIRSNISYIDENCLLLKRCIQKPKNI